MTKEEAIKELELLHVTTAAPAGSVAGEACRTVNEALDMAIKALREPLRVRAHWERCRDIVQCSNCEPTINLKNDNFGAVLNCAVRYSLGRRTYMPGLVMDFVGPLLPYISDKALWCLERDIKGFVELYAAECPPKSIIDRMDIEQWERFLQAIRRAIDERTAETG